MDQGCHPLCVGKTHYNANGSCPEECGEKGYCCKFDDGPGNKCSKALKAAYTFPSFDKHYCLIKSPDQWSFPKHDEDCWNNCGSSGECDWCMIPSVNDTINSVSKGYCCSGKKLHINGNCPSDAVNHISNKTSDQRHMCVAQLAGQ